MRSTALPGVGFGSSMSRPSPPANGPAGPASSVFRSRPIVHRASNGLPRAALRSMFVEPAARNIAPRRRYRRQGLCEGLH
jgi:hypothetical protein